MRFHPVDYVHRPIAVAVVNEHGYRTLSCNETTENPEPIKVIGKQCSTRCTGTKYELPESLNPGVSVEIPLKCGIYLGRAAVLKEVLML